MLKVSIRRKQRDSRPNNRRNNNESEMFSFPFIGLRASGYEDLCRGIL
jgi:hypothetical protein